MSLSIKRSFSVGIINNSSYHRKSSKAKESVLKVKSVVLKIRKNLRQVIQILTTPAQNNEDENQQIKQNLMKSLVLELTQSKDLFIDSTNRLSKINRHCEIKSTGKPVSSENGHLALKNRHRWEYAFEKVDSDKLPFILNRTQLLKIGKHIKDCVYVPVCDVLNCVGINVSDENPNLTIKKYLPSILD